MHSFCDFTVLMAVHKNDDPILFNSSIKSVYENSIQPNELLIVSDGVLTPALNVVVDSYIHRRDFRLIKYDTSQGLAYALNIGLKSIRTEFTIRADSDDINLPNRFECLLNILSKGYDLVGSSILEVDKSGKKVAIRRPPLSHQDILQFSKKRNPFNHMSVGYRTKTIICAGGYPNIYLREDYALWAILLSKNISSCNLDLELVHASAGRDMYRRRGGVKYALGEFRLQLHLVRLHLKGPLSATLDGSIRAIIFLLPNFLREFIYLNLLRKTPNFPND